MYTVLFFLKKYYDIYCSNSNLGSQETSDGPCDPSSTAVKANLHLAAKDHLVDVHVCGKVGWWW